MPTNQYRDSLYKDVTSITRLISIVEIPVLLRSHLYIEFALQNTMTSSYISIKPKFIFSWYHFHLPSSFVLPFSTSIVCTLSDCINKIIANISYRWDFWPTIDTPYNSHASFGLSTMSILDNINNIIMGLLCVWHCHMIITMPAK